MYYGRAVMYLNDMAQVSMILYAKVLPYPSTWQLLCRNCRPLGVCLDGADTRVVCVWERWVVASE